MLSIRAKYDGKQLWFSEKVEVSKEEEVIVVFLNRTTTTDSDVSGAEIQSLLMDSGSMAFLESEVEDVYSDKDLKVVYN
jgi:hypothetical protein